jgi:hypothetical protein
MGVFRSAVASVRPLRHVVRSRIAEHPAVYLPFARWKYPGPSPEVIGPQTELVIDGYTRSATTFAVYAFQLAQERPVRLAHHLHAPAQLIAAAKAGVPAVVLIREPEGAVLSQLVREPNVALRHALVAYARFYSSLLPYRDAFVIGEFEQVTRDFGSVVRRINERFETSFGAFEPTEANRQECLDLVRQRPTRIPRWSTTLLSFESGLVTRNELRAERERFARHPDPSAEGEVWVPSVERDRSKEALRSRWLDASLAELRERAELVYEELRPAMAER